MQRFLDHSLKFNCLFKMNQTPLCEQFNELNNHIIDDDIDEIDESLHQLLSTRFQKTYTATSILHLMVVFIDGACATIAQDQRQGSWGIY